MILFSAIYFCQIDKNRTVISHILKVTNHQSLFFWKYQFIFIDYRFALSICPPLLFYLYRVVGLMQWRLLYNRQHQRREAGIHVNKNMFLTSIIERKFLCLSQSTCALQRRLRQAHGRDVRGCRYPVRFYPVIRDSTLRSWSSKAMLNFWTNKKIKKTRNLFEPCFKIRLLSDQYHTITTPIVLLYIAQSESKNS